MGDYRFARGFGAIVCAAGDGGAIGAGSGDGCDATEERTTENWAVMRLEWAVNAAVMRLWMGCEWGLNGL